MLFISIMIMLAVLSFICFKIARKAEFHADFVYAKIGTVCAGGLSIFTFLI